MRRRGPWGLRFQSIMSVDGSRNYKKPRLQLRTLQITKVGICLHECKVLSFSRRAAGSEGLCEGDCSVGGEVLWPHVTGGLSRQQNLWAAKSYPTGPAGYPEGHRPFLVEMALID